MDTYDLIIIGGGPAGITASVYAARKRIKTLLITKDFLGQVARTSEVDNYLGFPKISGIELMRKFKKHVEKLSNVLSSKDYKGIKIIKEEVVNVKKQRNNFLLKTKTRKEFSAKALIIATGSDPRPLEVVGEKEFIGKGVSYCSSCDASFFKGKIAVIVGGGNSGLEAVLDLVKYAKRIFIFEMLDRLKADEILQDRVQFLIKHKKNIEIFLNTKIQRINGKKKVQSIVYKNLKTGKTFQMPVDKIFIQVGLVPSTSFLKGIVKFNQKDEIIVDFETCKTSMPGIFAAGDVNNGKWKQIVLAAGDGTRAALSAYDYLQKSR